MPPDFSTEFIAKLEREPAEVQRAYLRTLTFDEKLDFALAVATRLDNLASRHSVSILDGLEQRLDTDSISRQVADRVLAKL
jgi:hypothetical protein